MRRLLSRLSILQRHEAGATITVVAVSFFVLVLVVGIAVDLGRMQYAHVKMSEALDRAALSTGAFVMTATPAERDAIANRYFTANFPTGFMGTLTTPVTIQANADNTEFTFNVSGSISTTFLRITGTDKLDISVSSQIIRDVNDLNLELALVLDNSGSMFPVGGPDKIQELKDAVTLMINILYGNNSTLPGTVISLIPFDSHVNIGTGFASMIRPPVPPGWGGCVDARNNGNDVTDTPPSPGNPNTLFPAYVPGPENCVGQASFLQTDKATILAAVNSMSAVANTRTDIGTAWGWHALSPRWRGLLGSATYPVDYGTPKALKAAVIMTDGFNFSSSDPAFNRATADANMAALCAGMNAAGIQVYTIAFNVAGNPGITVADQTAIRSLLMTCASQPDYFFDAPNGPGLVNAFKVIADALIQLRLTR